MTSRSQNPGPIVLLMLSLSLSLTLECSRAAINVSEHDASADSLTAETSD